MFIAELEHPDFDSFDLSSLRTGIMAGSPCPVEVMRKVIDRMHMDEVTICYGMTETSPVSTQTGADDALEQPRRHRRPRAPARRGQGRRPGDRRIVARGEPGELCTRGYTVMLGYWDEPERTAEAIDAAGWMHTGDLATMDDEGYVKIVGRSKDMIIRGGENVYPREIEEFLYSHEASPTSRSSACPTSATARRSCAFVILREGATVDRGRCASSAAAASRTTRCRATSLFVDEFPMTVTGKVQKFKLRDQALQSGGLAP